MNTSMVKTMTNETPCTEHEVMIQENTKKIAELETRADYKDRRLDQLDNKMDKIEDKIDKLTATVNEIMLHSIQDDNNLNQRVTTLESRQETLYKLLLATPAIIALLGVIAVYLSYIH